MKFLILTQYYPPEIGASQTRLAAFAKQLVLAGHSVEVLTALPNYPTGKIFSEYKKRWLLSEKRDGITVHRSLVYASSGAGLKRMLNYGSFVGTSLLAMGRVRKPDWIFVESPPPSLALSALFVGIIWRVPVIVNVADLWPDSARAMGLLRDGLFLRFLEKLERFVYRHARLVNAVTEGIRRRLIEDKGVALAKVTFLPNGVDPEIFRPLPPDESLKQQLQLSGSKIVLYAGTHGYAHGLEHVLDCAKILAEQNIHFLFVGDGSEKPRLMKRADKLQLKNVTFSDPVASNQLPRYFSIADCGLVPQRKLPLFEGNRPAKMFSAMACAKPIVFSGEGEGACLVSDARAGLLVPPEDPIAMAAAIREIMTNPSLARELGQNGREFVRSNFTWPLLVRDWLEKLPVSNQLEPPLPIQNNPGTESASTDTSPKLESEIGLTQKISGKRLIPSKAR